MIITDEIQPLLVTGLSLSEICKLIRDDIKEEKILQTLRKYGENYLRRYTIFKNYQSLIRDGEQKLPLIFLITGMPSIGKTRLAKEIAMTFNIGQILGGDCLRSAIRSQINRKKSPEFFTSVYDSWKVFGKKSETTLTKGFQQQAKIMNDVVLKIVADRGIRDGESMIIEYLHFLPSQWNQEVLNHISIIPIFLKITNRELYKKRMLARSHYSHLKSPGTRLLKHIDDYLLMQKFQTTQAEQYNFPVFSLDNFEKSVQNIIDYIIERLEKINQLKKYPQKIDIVNKIEKERRNK
ncbi:MAG: hypothetical protein U9O98_08665 [Asgard group archaeon]|nr:hypothetical protein [Asgard group archaeon]